MEETRLREIMCEVLDERARVSPPWFDHVYLGMPLDERARVSPEIHGEHHDWIKSQIDKEKKRGEMYASIAKAAISWSIPAIFGALLYFLQHFSWPPK